MKIAEKNDVKIPIIKVVAKPLIGPVPNKKRINAVKNVVTFESIIAENALLYPSFTAKRTPLPARSSFV